jgi:hypothetical protein
MTGNLNCLNVQDNTEQAEKIVREFEQHDCT